MGLRGVLFGREVGFLLGGVFENRGDVIEGVLVLKWALRFWRVRWRDLFVAEERVSFESVVCWGRG